MMKKLTMAELWRAMNEFNTKNPDKEDSPCLAAVIVYKQSNFNEPYTETERSYEVWNNNRHFQNGKIANSLFGYCLDGKDMGVRLDWYNWDVEYCYLKGESDVA